MQPTANMGAFLSLLLLQAATTAVGVLAYIVWTRKRHGDRDVQKIVCGFLFCAWYAGCLFQLRVLDFVWQDLRDMEREIAEKQSNLRNNEHKSLDSNPDRDRRLSSGKGDRRPRGRSDR